jgi:hypothetical protein
MWRAYMVVHAEFKPAYTRNCMATDIQKSETQTYNPNKFWSNTQILIVEHVLLKTEKAI